MLMNFIYICQHSTKHGMAERCCQISYMYPPSCHVSVISQHAVTLLSFRLVRARFVRWRTKKRTRRNLIRYHFYTGHPTDFVWTKDVDKTELYNSLLFGTCGRLVPTNLCNTYFTVILKDGEYTDFVRYED